MTTQLPPPAARQLAWAPQHYSDNAQEKPRLMPDTLTPSPFHATGQISNMEFQRMKTMWSCRGSSYRSFCAAFFALLGLGLLPW